MTNSFYRSQSLNCYPIEEIIIINTLKKSKQLNDNIPCSSHKRLSNVTQEEEKNKATSNSDSELYKNVLTSEKPLPDSSPRRSAIYTISADTIKNINSAPEISEEFNSDSVPAVDLIPSQPRNDCDRKIFWAAIIVLIIYGYISRLIYDYRT